MYLHRHYLQADTENTRLIRLTLQFFTSPVYEFQNWVRMHNTEPYSTILQVPWLRFETIETLLYHASIVGLERIVHQLIGVNVSSDTDVLGSERNSASYWTYLVSAQGEEDDDALRVAASEGYHSIVQLLLEKKEDPDTEGGWFSNAVEAARIIGVLNSLIPNWY
jgi:hypothetical protein